jgi:hypothetical protein
MNSYFMQREGGRLYRIVNTDQQEYGAAFVLNSEMPSLTNPMQKFLASLTKSATKSSSTFHASLLDGCPMTPTFSCIPSLCHLMCLLVVLSKMNNRFNRGVIGK